MTFKQAVAIMMAGPDSDAIEVINAAVEPLCTTDANNNADSSETRLCDWIADGCYDGTETPESIAAEWDALSE